MKILLLNSIGAKKWGGGEKWVVTTALGLTDLGHDVVIGCRKDSILAQKVINTPIQLVNISVKSDFDLVALFKLISIFNEGLFDVCIGCLNKDVKIAGLASRFSNRPLIIARQGVAQLSNKWKYRFYFKNLCDGIITNTLSIKRLYDSFGWWDDHFVKVIYNGLAIPDRSEAHFSFSINDKSLPPHAKVVLAAGRLASQKGFEYLIEAAALVKESNSNIYFFIAGDGRYKHELQTLIASLNLQSHVFLLGFYEDITPLLQNSDLFVLSSLYEGMPNVLLEALSCGTPIVSTRVNGVEEVLQNGKFGRIVEAASSSQLANAILDFFDSEPDVRRIEEGKQWIFENFSVLQMCHNIETYLNERIMEKRKKSILIIQTAFIGDVILVTPLIESLAKEHPNWKIDVLVRKGNELLLANNPHINEVIVFDKRSGKFKNLIRLIHKIRAAKYDEVINIQRYFTTGLITAFSGAKNKVGFDKNPLSFLFNKRIKHQMSLQNTKHEVERNLETIAHLVKEPVIRPQLYPSNQDYDFVYRDNSYVTMAPSSVWFTKALPKAKWVELINKVDVSYDIILLGAKGDVDLCNELLELSSRSNVYNCAGEFTFLQSAALMSKAKMNFVNDSGPLHLASSVNAPVRAFFCSTVKAFGYTPLSSDSKVIEVDELLECRPCGLHGKRVCPKGHFKCGNIDVAKALV